MHHPTDRIVHITAFVIPVVEHWLEQVNVCVRERESEREYMDICLHVSTI